MRYEPAQHPKYYGSSQTALATGPEAVGYVTLDRAREGYPDVLADPGRLNALHRLDILDVDPEEAFKSITDVVRHAFGVRVARIHLLDDIRQWVQTNSGDTACFGIPVTESVCQYTIRQYGTLVVPDLLGDEEFQQKIAVIDGETMRFYAGAPLTTSDGHNVGVLCLLDTEPRPEGLDKAGRELLEKMAELTTQTMELRRSQEGAREDLLRAVDQEPVTGLVSRRGLLLRCQRLLEDVGGEDGKAVACIELRLGRIDRVEQAYGTSALNQLLRDIAERLGAQAQPQEVVGRPDDSGMLVLAPLEASTPKLADERIEARAGSLVQALAEPFDIDGDSFQPEVSVGIARGPADSHYAHELMSLAHEAAIRAGKRRSGRIAWTDHQAVAAERQKLSLEGRLRRAVAQREFTVFYQPVMALQGGSRVVGAEALLRWPQGSDELPMGPDVFIPLAEELGLMDRLGLQVFEDSCQQLARWQQASGNSDFWVSVNLAPVQLQDPTLASQFVAIAQQAGVAPSDVKLEITESAFEDGFDVAGQVIDDLAAAGFPLALDDFGTGHSSLCRLINMPFNLLKVDRSFVDQTPDGPGAAVVSSLGQLASCLHLESLGEGVETQAHETFLRELGYAFAQGYHYSKPLPAAEFDAWRAAR